MNSIEMILKLMEPELTQPQLAKLKNVLQTILRTSRNAPPNEELLRRFIQHKKLVGLKDSSLKNYVYENTALADGVGKRFPDITTADIKDYLTAVVAEHHIGANTVQTKIRAYSSFFEFLANEDYIDKNPTLKIERVMIEKKIKKAFSEDDIDALRKACNNKRDRAFVEFLYSTGARISEALALNVGDVNFAEKEVIVFGKGHKERVVYLSDACCKYLQDYLEDRYAQVGEPLFSHHMSTNRLTARGSQLILKEIGDRAGVENVHPHRFRRTMATHLMDKGMPVEQIKEVLGHERIDTTMIYCNVNTGKVKANFMEAFNSDPDV